MNCYYCSFEWQWAVRRKQHNGKSALFSSSSSSPSAEADVLPGRRNVPKSTQRSMYRTFSNITHRLTSTPCVDIIHRVYVSVPETEQQIDRKRNNVARARCHRQNYVTHSKRARVYECARIHNIKWKKKSESEGSLEQDETTKRPSCNRCDDLPAQEQN